VVTKADLERAEAGLKAEIARSEAALQVEIARVETALRAEITAFRGEVRTNLARMNDGGEQLRATVAGMENRLRCYALAAPWPCSCCLACCSLPCMCGRYGERWL
jgi:hypothetical protein